MSPFKIGFTQRIVVLICSSLVCLAVAGCTSYSATLENAAGVRHECTSSAASEIGRRMLAHAMENCRIVLHRLGYLPDSEIGETGIKRLGFNHSGNLVIRQVAEKSAADGKVKVGASVLRIDGQRPGSPAFARTLLFGERNEPVFLLMDQDARRQLLRLNRLARE